MAQIAYPELNLTVTMTASQGLDWLMVYANPQLDTFCLEPQSHLPGAHNLANFDRRFGLVELRPGEKMACRLKIRADDL